MPMVTELVIKLFDSVSLYCFSNCILSSFFHPLMLRKKEMLFANILVTASWDLYYSTRLLCGEGTVGCHFGSIFENRFSPAAAAVLSTAYFLPVRNAAPKRVRAVYVSPVCSVFLFVLFLPLPQNSKKGLVAWQVWCKRSAAPQLLPLLEQSRCFDSLWSAFSKYTSQELRKKKKSVFSPNATCVATCQDTKTLNYSSVPPKS